MALLSRAEAASFCRSSIDAFDKHVRPHLPELQVGRAVLFRLADLHCWASTPDGPAPAVKPALQLDDADRQALRRMLSRQQRVAAGVATADEVDVERALARRPGAR